MSERDRWEEKHRSAHTEMAPPSAFVRRQLAGLVRGRALDVACGGGRHSVLLARHGFAVDAVDLADAAVRRLQRIARAEPLPISLVQADLETFPLARDRYAVIVNSRYLQRTLWPQFKGALAGGGVLLFETFLIGQEAIGHPRNPAFLLAADELRHAFADLDILHYEEGLMHDDGEPAYLARLVARRPSLPHP